MIITLFVILIGTLGCSCATLNPLDLALVHSNIVHKVDLTKDDIARTGKSFDEISQFGGNFGGLQFTNESLLPKYWEVIEFKLKLRANETVFNVKIFNKTILDDKPHRVFVTPVWHPVMEYFETDYDSKLHQVNITLGRKQVCFAVWDMTVDQNISISTKQIGLRVESNWPPTLIDSSYGSQLYLVNTTTRNRDYLNFTFDDPESSKEYCFWLSASAKTQIDLYISLFGAKQPNKLTRLHFPTTRLERYSTGWYKEICITDYLYVRQLGKFDLSLVFNAQMVDSDDEELVVYFKAIRLVRKDARHYSPRVYQPPPGPGFIDSHANDGSVGWWYNNPGLFGYKAVANPKSQLYVCDILANCYHYERGQAVDQVIQVNETANATVHMWNFALPEQFKPLLSHSPLIRLYSDDPSYTVFRSTPYLNANKLGATRIESHLRTSSPKLQLVSKFDIGQIVYHLLQVPRQTRIPLEIPLNAIDLRAEYIYVSIQPLNESVGAKVNIVSKLNNISNANGVFTASYFKVASSKMPNDDQLKLLQLEFEVDKSQNVNDSQLVDWKIEFTVNAMYGGNTVYKDNVTVPTFGSENCNNGPTYADLDCHHDEYQCPEYYFKYDPVKKICSRTDSQMHH